jgi:hypothetical protein
MRNILTSGNAIGGDVANYLDKIGNKELATLIRDKFPEEPVIQTDKNNFWLGISGDDDNVEIEVGINLHINE